MNMLTLAAQVSLLLALATFIWLLSRAFSRHSGWGVAILLFSPVSAIAFGIRNWRLEKIPFLAYLLTTTSAIALSLYLFTSWGGWELLQTSQHVRQGIAAQTLGEHDFRRLLELSQAFDEQSGLDTQSFGLLSQAQRELARQAAHQAAIAAAAAEAGKKKQNIASLNRKVKAPQQRYRFTYITIRPADASSYVGSTVKVTRKNVVEKEYRLIGASGGRLEFAQRAGSGSYRFKYRHSDIEKIRVLTKQPY